MTAESALPPERAQAPRLRGRHRQHLLHRREPAPPRPHARLQPVRREDRTQEVHVQQHKRSKRKTNQKQLSPLDRLTPRLDACVFILSLFAIRQMQTNPPKRSHNMAMQLMHVYC